MSRSTITIWNCDAGECGASAPEDSAGWTDAIYTHGCPAHGTAIEAHRAKLTHDTRGRGHREKTTWYLFCACGWMPSPYYATHSSLELRRQHLVHVDRTTLPVDPGDTYTTHLETAT
jgi:hypothetical protein